MTKKIFVVDDDENIRELMKLYLDKEGYKVEDFASGELMLKAFQIAPPDLVVLDVMMPGLDGYDVLKAIRKTSEVPVIMVTAKDETIDKILGLELGADDYVVKPFEPKELTARVKAVIRRIKPSDAKEVSNVLQLPSLEVNMTDYNITYAGEVMDLPPKEIELLFYLASHPNRVFTREQLLDQIWGYDFFGETRTVDVHVKRLREKLEGKHQGWEIKTVWGVGYKMKVD